jgi:DNA repair ATPase RecN
MTKSKTSSATPKQTTSRKLRRSPPVATREGRAQGHSGQLTPAGPPRIDRLTVRNYQSIAEADVRLGGLTVIVGPNDSGKTALQRALMALAFNQTGDKFIRYGEEEAEVSVEVDGLMVCWQKNGSASYRIDDGAKGRIPARNFDKLGAAVPDPIADVLGLRVIEVDATTKLTPQFRRHGDTPFLLDETATKAARVLAKNSRLDILVQALAAQKKALRDIGKKLDTDAAQHERLEQRLGEFPDLSVAEERAAEVQESMGRIEAAIAGIQAAQDYRLAKARVQTLQSLVEGLPDIAALADRLNALVPAYERLERALEAQEGALEAQADAEAEAAQAEATLREFAEGIDVCPVCGQPVEPDMLLEHED